MNTIEESLDYVLTYLSQHKEKLFATDKEFDPFFERFHLSGKEFVELLTILEADGYIELRTFKNINEMIEVFDFGDSAIATSKQYDVGTFAAMKITLRGKFFIRTSGYAHILKIRAAKFAEDRRNNRLIAFGTIGACIFAAIDILIRLVPYLMNCQK